MTHTSIAVTTPSFDLHAAAKALALQLNLPFVIEDADNNFDYVLILTHENLGLQKTHSPTKPLVIDFSAPEFRYRLKHLSRKKENLIKALGLKSNTHPNIIDVTAGLARDSFIIAALGYEITLIERSPIVHALIENGIKNAAKIPEIAPIMHKMSLIHGDTITLLPTLNRPEIIYLDPMFPTSNKTALSKHDMRIFHEVVGNDLDSDQLLHTALACASQRVVVKRPRLAPPIADLPPSFSITGSSSRFDVYLART